MDTVSVFSVVPLSLAVAFLLGFGARQIGLPPLVGFLVAGFVLSAFGVQANEGIEALGDFGVTLLLFTIGLKLKFKNLARPEVSGVTTLHALATTLAFGLALYALSYTGYSVFAGLDLWTALLIGFALSFSSTVFAVKVLERKGELSSLHGRTAIGILIMQDVLAVAFLSFSTGKLPSLWAPALIALLLLRPVLGYFVDRTGHGELLPLFGMFSALAIGVTAFELVGLKADLGALALGMLLANHKRASDVADSLFEFKEVFLVGFFLHIGLAGAPNLMEFSIAVALSVLVPLKVALFFFLLTRFRLRAWSSALASLSLATYSEFGLIVGAIGVSNGWIDERWLSIIAVALSISIIVASPASTASHRLYARFRQRLKRFETEAQHPEEQPIRFGDARIIVFGMGRVGTGAYEYARQHFGDTVLGIDSNPDKVAAHQEAGRNVVLGDATDPAFWERAERRDIRMVLLAMPEHRANLYALQEIISAGTEIYVAALAKYPDEARMLEAAGATVAFDMYSEAGAGFAAELEARIKTLGAGC